MLPCEANGAAGSISGYISGLFDSHGSKAHQLLYLNKRCGACHAADKLVNELHAQLLACQGSGQDQSRRGDARAAVGNVTRFPAFVILLTCTASTPAFGTDSASEDCATLLRLLRGAVLSAWKADVPDSFTWRVRTQPLSGIGKQGEAPNWLSRSSVAATGQPARRPASAPPVSTVLRCSAGNKQMQGKKPAAGRGLKPPVLRRQLIASEKRMAGHSAPVQRAATHDTAADQPGATAAALPHGACAPATLAEDILPRTGLGSAAARLPRGSCTWAATARLCLSPAQQQHAGDNTVREDFTALNDLMPAKTAWDQFASRMTDSEDVCRRPRPHGSLREPTTADSTVEQLLHSADQATDQEDRRRRVHLDLASRLLTAAPLRTSGHAAENSAAGKKRGRRASWPAMPQRKRRAVHKNPAESLRTSDACPPAGFPVEGSSPEHLRVQQDLTTGPQTAGSDQDCVYAAAVAGSSTRVERSSTTLHGAYRWRQSKLAQPERVSSVLGPTTAKHTLHRDDATAEPQSDFGASTRHMPSQWAGLASAPTRCGAPRSTAELSEDSRQPLAAAQPLAEAQPFTSLLTAWQNPCIGYRAAERGVLQLGDLTPGLAYLTVPQAVERADFMRARVLQQVRRMPLYRFDVALSGMKSEMVEHSCVEFTRGLGPSF